MQHRAFHDKMDAKTDEFDLQQEEAEAQKSKLKQDSEKII